MFNVDTTQNIQSDFEQVKKNNDESYEIESK